MRASWLRWPLRWLLRILVFPTGLLYDRPCDSLSHEAAQTLLSVSGVRDRLTDGIYLTRDPDQKTGQLETALALIEDADRIEGTLIGNPLIYVIYRV